MSDTIGRPPYETPLADPRGSVTRAWLPWFQGLTAAGTALSAAQTALTALQARIASDESDIAGLDAGIAAVEATQAQAAGAIADLQTLTATLAQMQNEQTLELGALSAGIDSLETEIDGLETGIWTNTPQVTRADLNSLRALVAAIETPRPPQASAYCVTWGVGIGGPATTGSNVAPLYVVPAAGVPLALSIAAKTAPTGSALVIDIRRNGSTILAAPASLAAGSNQTSSTNFAAGIALAIGDVLTLNVNQVGSSVAGQDITIQLQIS